jgi:hypothetical protein
MMMPDIARVRVKIPAWCSNKIAALPPEKKTGVNMRG